MFVKEIPPPGLYGQQQHTLLSLVMTHIRRTTDPESKSVIDTVLVSPSGEPVINTLAKYLQFQTQKSEVSQHVKCNFITIVIYLTTALKPGDCGQVCNYFIPQLL